MEVQGSSWSAREKKVKHDNVKVEVEELEPMVSPEDSEVNLKYILMNASRRSRKSIRDPQHERKKGALSCKHSALGAAPETAGRDELRRNASGKRLRTSGEG